MKYIISEHKLNKLIFEFIDDFLKKNRQSFDSFIIYSFEVNYNEDDPTIEYDYEDGRLFIHKNFVMLIANMFGLTPQQSQLKIYDWFTVTEGVFPKFMESPYLEGFWRQNAPRRD
jgi:hypothetical protein